MAPMSRPSPAEIKVEVLNEAEAKPKSEPKTRPKPKINKSKPTTKRTAAKAKTTRMNKNRIKWRLSDFLESSPRLSAAKRLARRGLI